MPAILDRHPGLNPGGVMGISQDGEERSVLASYYGQEIEDLVGLTQTDLNEVESAGSNPLDLPHWSTMRSMSNPDGQPHAREEIKAVIKPFEKAAEKIKKGVPLEADEALAAEAVVILYGRPALLVQDDDFGQPPPNWAMLAFKRSEITSNLPSIGRVEFALEGLPHIGTGFLVGPELVMTNRHVAQAFAVQKDGRWNLMPFISARIDYKEERDRPNSVEFKIEEVLGVHDVYDLALLRVVPRGDKGEEPPPPLRIMAARPESLEDQFVYVVGYPAKDDKRNDPKELERIFDNIYNCKRLQPGKLRGFGVADYKGAPTEPILFHDCATLGGNSGSAVLDMATSKVIALHYGGHYGKGNYAVPLWRLSDDPLLRKHGVQFE